MTSTATEGGTTDHNEVALATYIESQQAYVVANNLMQFAAEYLLLTQMGMNTRIKEFGQKGIDTIIKEMRQLHDREVVNPMMPNTIASEIRKRALGYLMFLKKKRNGDIKGRGCADGRPQRVYMSKSETSSPTVFTESIFIGSAMDAKEGRDVAHVDIPGAFLQTEASHNTIIKLQGVLVITLTKINPDWKKFMTYEGRNPQYTTEQRKLYTEQ